MAVDNGTASGSYVGFKTSTQKLTSAGQTDWRLWGRSSTSLSGNARKAGGSGISDLSRVTGSPVVSNTSLRALGNCCGLKWGNGVNTVPFAFDWSDGSSTASTGSKVLAGLQHYAGSSPLVGYGFSFTVPATATPQRLTLWVHAHHGTGTLKAVVGSVTGTDPGVVGGENYGRIYTIDFAGDGTAGQQMTVSYVLASVGTNTNASNVAVYAAALSPLPDFTIGAAPAGLTVQQGAQASSTINVAPVGAATGAVALSAVASNAGITPALSSASYVLGSTPSPALTVSASASVAPGSYTVDVTGVLGVATHTTTVTVTVPQADFTIASDTTSSTPLALQQGKTGSSTLTIAPVGASTGTVNLAVTALDPGLTALLSTSSYVLGSTPATTVSLTAGADLAPGAYTATVTGTFGSVSHSATVYVTVPTPGEVGVPQLTNAYNAPNSGVTLYAGRISALPNTNYTISFASAASCPSGVFPAAGATGFGSITVKTDGLGNAFFASGANGGISGTPGAGQTFISAHVTGPAGRTSGYSPCVVNSPDNNTWPRALDISSNGHPTLGTTIDQPGAARWFKVHVNPGGSVTVDLSSLPKDYDVYLFKDISQTYAGLTGEQNLTKLSAEFAGSGFSGSGFSGSGFSGSGFSGSGFSGSGFSGSGFSGSGFSADSYSGSGFSGSGFSGSGFSGSGFSGSGFSGSGFSGSGFSGSGFSGSGFSAESFSAAQVYSLLGWSNNLGTSDEIAGANTWTNAGDYYIRVNGKNGIYDLEHPFTLDVTVNGSLCSTVGPIGSAPAPIPNSYSTIILTDTSRFTAGTSAMMTSLGQLATVSNGTVVDLAGDNRVHGLEAQADAHTGCVYATNLVAEAAKDVVDAYRAGSTSGGIKDIVIAGGDGVVPFFRYPDTSSIGPEVNYFPPVQGNSSSEASLRSNYVLGQDAYGASQTLSLGAVEFPIPDLPVGRLVETPAEIAGMVAAYLGQPVVSPSTSLVTGYDFIADAATAIKANLDAGTGHTGTSLIDPYGASPSTGWTATQLKDALLGTRNDISFLGGHFSANSALAADFATVMTTNDFVATPTDLSNSIILSIGCHSGYNIVDAQGIPDVTNVLDWPQAFAQKRVTSILGTGYQYGDTDFIEYSERIYTEVSKQLRYGTGAVAIGDALTAAKVAYLTQTPNLGDLHEKALLEATLYGIPMLGVDLANRVTAPSSSGSIGLSAFSTEPALTTGLRYANVTQQTPSVKHQKTLNVVDSTTKLTATWYTAPDGKALTTPGAPILPLYAKTVTAGTSGYVLRGVGFRGGSYTDTGVVPLTGAPGTELQTAHTSFNSPTFYPTQMWSANYFDAMGGGGGTTLFTTPAQHRAPDPGSPNAMLRLYDNLDLRLFYTKGTGEGTKSAGPVIYGTTSDLDSSGKTLVQAHVVGDPNADVQQVWITYTEPDSGTWQSFDLARDATDPTLWAGTRSLAAGTLFMVQAVNGYGLVTLDTNSGSYYLAGIAAPSPAASGITLSAAATGTFGTSASITATLSSGGNPVQGKQVTVSLGQATRSDTTDANGQVSVTIQLQAAAGDYPMTASFIGDQTTLPTTALGTFTISKAGSSVTVTCPPSVPHTGSALTPCTATASGTDLNQPLVVSYSSNTAVGTATASATFYGDTAHTSSSKTATFSIVPADQTIAFGLLSGKTYGDAAFTVSATASSGLAVTYGAAPASACTVVPATGVVTITGAGTCTITADQAGNTDFNPAPSVSQSFAIAKAGASLTLSGLDATYDGTQKSAVVTTTPVGLTGVAVTYDGSATAPTNAGSYTVVATLDNPNYQAANATGTLKIAKATQTITFGSLANKTYGDAPFTVSATAGSGLAVTFAAAPAAGCTVDTTTGLVTITGAGSCTITASQGGGDNHAAATDVAQAFSIAKASASLALSGLTQAFNGSPRAVTVTTTPTGLTGVTVTYNGSATAPTAVGTYSVMASLVNDNYQASNVSGTLVIQQAASTLTLTAVARTPNPTVQVSDTFDLVATLPAGATGSVVFKFNGVACSPTSAPVAADGTARVSVAAPNAAGDYPATATFTALPGSPYGSASAVTITVTVQREGQTSSGQPDGSSRLDYTGTQFAPVHTAPVLSASLFQSLNPETGDTAFVDFSKVTVNVVFSLYPAGCDTACAETPTWTSGNVKVGKATTWTSDGAGKASVTGPKTLGAGAYIVVVTTVDNLIILPQRATSVLAVATTNGQYINGGGHLAADSTSNAPNKAGAFGFDLSSGSDGPPGSVAYVYRVRMNITTSSATSLDPCSTLSTACRDVDILIRSAPVGNYVHGQSASGMSTVSDTGNAVVQYVDAADGTHYTSFESSTGAYRFDAMDAGSGGTADSFGFTQYRADGTVFHQAFIPDVAPIDQTGIGVATNQAVLGDGNVTIK